MLPCTFARQSHPPGLPPARSHTEKIRVQQQKSFSCRRCRSIIGGRPGCSGLLSRSAHLHVSCRRRAPDPNKYNINPASLRQFTPYRARPTVPWTHTHTLFIVQYTHFLFLQTVLCYALRSVVRTVPIYRAFLSLSQPVRNCLGPSHQYYVRHVAVLVRHAPPEHRRRAVLLP
jgi:hypothetical protein